jgi:hypothetical protein
MNKLFNRLIYVCAVLLMLIPLVSCSGGGGGASGTAGGTTGTLSIGLTDAPGDYQNVWVTIKEIRVHQAVGEVGDEDPGWITVLTFSPGKTIDLTTLEDGNVTDLGVAELDAGQYNQMRLILTEDPVAPHSFANYVVIEGEEEEEYVIGQVGQYYTIEELKVPSGFKTGVKIVKGFEIVADQATALILDFDAQKSVVKAGNSGQWLLKPTIKVLDTVTNSVSGVVKFKEEENEFFLENASVSAQIDTPPPSEPPPDGWDRKDEVTVVSSDDTDALGDYTIYLAPDTYNVIAAMAGYATDCKVVAATPGYFDYSNNNFTLTVAGTGTVAGEITGLAEEVEFVTLSFRQTLDCGSGNVKVEVLLVDIAVALDNSYDVSLSVGDYQLVVFAENQTTLEFPVVTVEEGLQTDQNISF